MPASVCSEIMLFGLAQARSMFGNLIFMQSLDTYSIADDFGLPLIYNLCYPCRQKLKRSFYVSLFRYYRRVGES